MLAFLAILLSRDATNLFYSPPPAPTLALALATVVVICGLFGWFWLRVAGSDDTIRASLALGGLLVAVTVFTALDPSRSYPFYYSFYYCAMVAGAAYPWRGGIAAVIGTTALAVVVVTLAGGRGTVATDLALVMLLLGGGSIAVRRHVANFVQLKLARDEIRRLAISEERLRLARDLHDELGQSLSTVVLQTELIDIELPASIEPATRARVRDVVATARSALESMREVVWAYRQPALEDELEEARIRLEALGIRCTLTEQELTLPTAVSAALGWVVREATTNVLRHSSAKTCAIEVKVSAGEANVRVIDDGAGATEPVEGGGLAGLKARLAALGGQVTTDSRPGEGFTLDARVPLPL